MNDTIVIGGSISLVTQIDGNVSLEAQIDGTPDKFMAVYPPSYTGAVEVTPSEEEQTLQTSGLYMSDNIVISPIPSNYGRIAYSGGIITVY